MNNIDRLKVTSDLSLKFLVNVYQRKITTSVIHWHDFYEIDLCLGGSGTTTLNGKVYPISKGYISFLTPSDFHSFDADEPLDILNLTFAPHCIEYSNFSEMLQTMSCLYSRISPEKLEKIQYFIENIKSEITGNKFLNKKYASHLLACLMIEILRINPKATPQSDAADEPTRAMQKMIYYVHAHFKEDITLESVSEYVRLSPGYVSKMFKKNLGYGFKELLTELRLKYAENLLLHSDESITDISYFCGFQSSSHFLRSFSKKYDMSPREFRKNNKSST